MKVNYKLICLVSLYYITSLSLGFLTKYFLSPGGYNFRFPLLKTGISNLIFYFSSSAYIKYLDKNKRGTNQIKIPHLLYTILPCSAIGAIDTGVSIYILRYVEYAFYTVIKSSSPVFILLIGFILGTENVSSFSFLSIITMVSGTFMVTVKPSNTINSNVYLLLASSIISGFRWTIIQLILKKTDSETKEHGMFYLIKSLSLPTSLIILFVSMVLVEGPKEVINSDLFSTPLYFIKNSIFLLILGFWSFFLLTLEYYIIVRTSVLFLSVSSIFKELMIVGISILRGSTCMTKLNYVGIAVSICGHVSYNVLRYKQ